MNPTKSSDADYHPAFLTGKLVGQWWIIAAAMILGALIGLGTSFVFHPVYQAAFTVTTSVKLANNPEINEFMVDSAIFHIGDLAISQNVIDKVIEAEKSQGIDLTQADLIRISTIERQVTSTFIKIEWNDPQIAAQIANTWGMIFYSALQEGSRQAIIADELTKTQTILQNCLAGIAPVPPPAASCTTSKSDLQALLDQNAEKIAAAKNLSLGLYPQLTVDAYQEAIVPPSPMLRARGWLVTAGTAIGLILALIAIEVIDFPKKNLSGE
ncbi:hypothetical protein EG834_15040 [bacterium]|nr:hypothetical protein [bacterium]